MAADLQTLLDELGGLTPIRGKKFLAASDADIAQFEDIAGGKFPEDYSWFLKNYGESMFNEAVGYKSVSEEAVYLHPDETELPNLTFKGSQLLLFFGKNKDDLASLDAKIDGYQGRMPGRVIPIGDDGLGNKITLSLADADYGKVYWWDHENEWDEEDYLEDVGKPMPEEAKYQNMYLIADSFTEFLEKLQVVQE